MIPRPPRSTRTDTLFPYTTLFRSRDIGIGTELRGVIHELVGAEAVVVGDAAPGIVDPHRAFFARADAVAPVILVGEAAAGPADDGDVQLFERGHHVAAIAVGVGDFRIGAEIGRAHV